MAFISTNYLAAFVLTIVIGLSVGTNPARADPLPERWQAQREAGIALHRRACNGDKAAISEVRRRIRNGNPVTLNGTEYLRNRCPAFKDFTKEDTAEFQRRAAEQDYPIAMRNYGIVLMYDAEVKGAKQDRRAGLALLERSLEAGYAVAGFDLARLYTTGKLIPPDLARAEAYFAKAAQDPDISDKELDAARAKHQENVARLRALTRSGITDTYGVTLSDLSDLSNGRTPSPSQRQVNAFTSYLESQ